MRIFHCTIYISSPHMHTSIMDRLWYWVQRRLGGKLIDENLTGGKRSKTITDLVRYCA